MTLMCSLSSAWPIYFEIREKSNTGFDFADFVINALKFNYMGRGDILVVDNWSGHFCNDNKEALEILQEEFGFLIVFLPAYSPELNPCEFVFGQIKKLCRKFFDHPTLLQNIIAACARVTIDHIQAYFRHCKESNDIHKGVEKMKEIVGYCMNQQRNE
jgi:transposase